MRWCPLSAFVALELYLAHPSVIPSCKTAERLRVPVSIYDGELVAVLVHLNPDVLTAWGELMELPLPVNHDDF